MPIPSAILTERLSAFSPVTGDPTLIHPIRKTTVTIIPAPPAERDDDPYFQEYLQNFLHSAHEIVQSLESDLLALEQRPDDRELIHRLFRGYHTLKGGARGAKWLDMADFAHKIETILSRLRDGELSLSAELVSLLLQSVDLLRRFLAEARGEGAPEAGDIAALLTALEPFHHTDQPMVQQETREGIINIINAMRADLPTSLPPSPAGHPPDSEWVGDCYRGFDIIQLAAGAAGLTALANHANQLADGLIPIENGSRPLTAALAPLLGEALTNLEILLAATSPVTPAEQQRLAHTLAALQQYPDPVVESTDPPASLDQPQPLGEILIQQQMVTEQDLLDGLHKQALLGDILVREGKLSEPDRDRALAIQKQQQEQFAQTETVTVRVDVAKLNRLINLVGEIGLFQGSLEQTLEILEQQTDGMEACGQKGTSAAPFAAWRATQTTLREIAHQGQQLTRAVQTCAVDLRLIPIGGLLHSLQRLVRETARQTGKLIRLEIRGAETEMDKNSVERLGDPFKHLLRNAIDHGIEPPAHRQALGKPPHGTLTLHAFYQGGRICIDVQDDGRGIDVAQVLACARQNNWIPEGENPSEAAVLDLLFRPGFSTAKEVTDLSGRGVGLDVVRQEIRALQGTVQIETRPGEGTRFHIQLPLTLAILDGIIVRIGQQALIIPTLSIVESLRPRPEPGQAVGKRPEKDRILWREKSLPLLYLNRLFCPEEPEEEPSMATILIVADAERAVGVWVDETLEQKPVLIKNLDEHFYSIPGIMGASVLDDGRVALILDIPWLLDRGERDHRSGQDGGVAPDPTRGIIPLDPWTTD